MGAVEEIHDRERDRAIKLIRRLAEHLRERENAATFGDVEVRDNGFVLAISFQVETTPLVLEIHVQP